MANGLDLRKRGLRVLDYIHTNPAGDLSLDALADVAAISRFHSHRVFHGMIGVYFDDPAATKTAYLRSHAGVVADVALPSVNGLDDVHLPIGQTTILHFKGHWSGPPAAYAHLYGTWLPASGHDAASSPAFEIYLNSPMDTAPENLLTDICLPLT